MASPFPSIYLVRHGQTAWSLSGQHTGRTDIPLTEEGQAQARALGPRLATLTLARVLSSPLLRARQTAQLAGFGDRLETEPALLEWHYGEYEGRRTSEIREERPGWGLFEDGAPGGETLQQVAARAGELIGRLRALPGNSLLFAHRDILRVLAARWAALPAIDARRLYLDPTSISTLGYDHSLDEPIIRVLNSLPDPAPPR
jgi:probable phosphoglycerate mutase